MLSELLKSALWLLTYFSFLFASIHYAATPRVINRSNVNSQVRFAVLSDVSKLDRLHDDQRRKERMLNAVLSKYDVDERVVRQAIKYAMQYERAVFPRAEHIVALIGIESSWKQHARSPLVSDPAVGLTQIRPGVWKHKVGDAKNLNEIKYQIKYSVEILDEYHSQLKHPTKTLLAYNSGLTAYREMRYNEQYVVKFKREMKSLDLKV